MFKKRLAFSKFQVSLLVLFLIPVVLVLWFINSFSVNVPYLDQWHLVPLFEKVATGQARFADFWALINEHRIFFPRLIFIALAFASKWNIHYELYLSVFLAIINFLALCKISYFQTKFSDKGWSHLANLLTCMLVFSLVQLENWLWGFQTAWFLVNVCITVAILIIYSGIVRSPIQRLFIASIPCFIASFSLAHGLLSWLALIPLVLSLSGNKNQRIKRLAIWMFFCVITFIIYFVGYQKPHHTPNTLFFLKSPLVAGHYFLNLLGMPLGQGFATPLTVAPILGILILFQLLFFVCICLSKNINSTFKKDAAPWLSLSLFALLFAGITTMGRAGFGLEQSMAPRYTTNAILLIIALVQMWRLFLCSSINKFRIFGKLAYGLFAMLLTGLIAINSANAIYLGQQLHSKIKYGQTCLELIYYINPSSNDCLKALFEDKKAVVYGALALQRIGFRDFPTELPFITEPSKDYGYLDQPPTRGQSQRIKQNETIKASGWAILPGRSEQPKMVLLSYGEEKTFFTSSPVNFPSPDVAKALHSRRYKRARWTVDFSAKSLPLGETVIKAWVYNPYEKQFVKLIGEPKLNVVEK